MSWSKIHSQTRLILHPGSSIRTSAGNGADAATSPDPKTRTSFGHPSSVAYDSTGNLTIADSRNHVISRTDINGNLTIIAGTGHQGFTGDNGPATAAQLNAPQSIALDTNNNLYIADTNNHRIRRVDNKGIITTIAGDGTSITLRFPTALAIAPNGDLVIADTGNHRIRKRSADGTLTTIAGTGEEGDTGDNAPALSATFRQPTGLAYLPDGRLLIADKAARRVRILNNDGTISAFTTLPLRSPQGISTDSTGNSYITDSGNHLIQQASIDGVSVIAGTGEQGPLTAGSPTATSLDTPAATASDTSGNLSIADRRNHQIQTITLPTIAFGAIPAGKISATQTLTLENGSATPLQITAINLPTAFNTTNSGTCTTTPIHLAPAATCTLTLTFAPTIQGPQSGTAQIHLASAAPQSILLTGIGSPPADLAPTTTTLTANGSISYAGSPITLTAAVSGPLSTPPIGNITFFDNAAPLATQSITTKASQFSTAALQIGTHNLHATYSGDAYNATSTSPTVTITVVPSPDFAITPTATTYTATANTTIPIPFTLQPINGTLNHAVTFAATGLPTGATIAFLPATITLGGDPTIVTLTVKLPATTAQTTNNSAIAVAMLLGIFTFAATHRRTRNYVLIAFAITTTTLITSCGGGFRGPSSTTTTSPTSPQPHTYNASITATTTDVLGSPLTHTTSFTLVVTP